MTNRIITDFEKLLLEVLNDTDSLFQTWESTDRSLRCTKALALLMRVVDVTNKFEVLNHHLKDCFPPVALTNYDDWCKSIHGTKLAVQKIVNVYEQAEQDGKTDLNEYLKEVLQLEADKHNVLVALEQQLTDGEKLLLETLTLSFDYLLEIMNMLHATLAGDRTEALTLLYIQAEARYKTNTWDTMERRRYLKHLQNTKYPWGYEPTVEQLRTLYADTFNNFSQSKLGKVYDEFHDSEPMALAIGISQTNCSTDELNDYFKQIYRLKELELLAEKKSKGVSLFAEVDKLENTQDNPPSHLSDISPFTPAVIDTTKAEAVITLLRQLMEGKTKPKDVLMPVRAAMDAGVIRRPTWEEFCQEFGSYRLKSKTSFSDYTNPDKSPYTGADFQMMKEKFRQLMSDGQ